LEIPTFLEFAVTQFSTGVKNNLDWSFSYTECAKAS
jgi:hypothetical protein